MLRFPAWKIISILAMTVCAVLLIVPSLLSPAHREELIARVPKWLPARAIVLGLDLQGGSHVLLEVDSNSVVKTLVDNLRDSVRRTLREEKVAITGGIGALPRGVQLRIPDPAERAKVMPKLRQLAASEGMGLTESARAPTFDVTENENGLIQFTVTEAGIDRKMRRAVDQSIEVLRRRVDALGTTEPNIQRQGADRVLVEVPGLQDTSKLKEILGTTAKLEFRLVAEPGADPSEVETLPWADQPGTLPVEKRVMVQGEDLTHARKSPSSISASIFAAASALARSHPKMSASSLPSFSTARSSRRRASSARLLAGRARLPGISLSRKRTSLPFSCARALCRRSSPL